jgi:hypothetical protein
LTDLSTFWLEYLLCRGRRREKGGGSEGEKEKLKKRQEKKRWALTKRILAMAVSKFYLFASSQRKESGWEKGEKRERKGGL